MRTHNLKNLIILFLSVTLLTFGCKEPEKKRPNILFAISDDQSFGSTSFGGSTFIKTPAFDKVASEGIYFTNCYSGSPGCAPSRSAIVTGRHHWQNEQSGQHASSWMKKYVPFVDLLDGNGYVTGRSGKGVGPFQYARGPQDSLWRATNAAGIEHSAIRYKDNEEGGPWASGIHSDNYFANFKYFMDSVRGDKPFFFWYGGHEPHRVFEQDSWKRFGKKLEDVQVPEFLPDNDLVRGDLLDYAVEIEWFDLHLQRMLEYLEEIGELDNTIVIVTADNGMAFPRAKANGYEYGVHVPMAIRYPGFPGRRTVSDPIGFADLAPTILELTETSSEGMLPISGKSIVEILTSDQSGDVSTTKQYAFSGRERHSSSRYLNWGFPQRIISDGKYLFTWNIKPDRWPAGAPQRLNPDDSTELWPMYGLDEEGEYMRNSAFTDIDDCPTKTYLIEHYDDEDIRAFFELALGKRPEFEFFDVESDPYCLNNLAGNPSYKEVEDRMKLSLMQELEKSGDPRVAGKDPEVFDSYIRYSGMRYFPKPDPLTDKLLIK
ncbi:MAG: sulfatase [Bacteroidota bacterium]